MKRSGFKPRTTGLTRQELRTKRTPLAYRSKKQAAIAREREGFVARVLGERPNCEIGVVGCTGRSTECHEPLQRSLGGPFVPSQGLTPDRVISVCRGCHETAHREIALAHERGWLVHSWDVA